MKDIDFDELDKAVGSALGSDDKTTSDTPAQLAPADSSTSQPLTTPATPQSEASPDASSPASPATPSVAPARRRGQFLDMVHPSANMRTRSPLPPPTLRKTITPLGSSITPDATEQPEPAAPEITQPTQDEPTPAPAPENPVTIPESESSEEPIVAVSTEPEPSNHSSWPDPIDFAQKAASPDDTAEPEESETEPQESADEPVNASAFNDASQTPFVTDAKVDKRPLGAFAAPDSEISETIPALEETGIPSDQEMAVPAEPLAPELNPEVNSVEAAGVEDHSELPQSSAAAPEPAPAVVPVLEKEPAKPAESPRPTGVAASIPQQYKPAAAKKDDQEHPLFDTEEYHQPLLPAHAKKRHKAGLTIVLLIALLAIGGVLGYFAFTMGF